MQKVFRPDLHAKRNFKKTNLISSLFFFFKVVKVLMMVVVLFTLAWLPLQGYYVAQSIFPEVNK